MNKEWAEKNKRMQILLNKEDTFEEGISLLIELRADIFNQITQIVNSYPEEAFYKMPYAEADGYHSKTLSYSIWHIFRIEDIVAHEMIAGDEQILFTNNYVDKIHTPVITTGNELTGSEIADFSKRLDRWQLYQYAKDVLESTNKILLSLTYKDLKRKFDNGFKEKLKATKCVSEDKEAVWLIDYWCSKDVKGLLKMPFSRHHIMHVEAMCRIKNKLCKGDKLMNRIECKPFAKEHIEAAKQIALENLQEEKEFVPELPEDSELWDIGFFIENGYGVVALDGESVVGYLCFFNPWTGAFDTENSLGTFSPLHANGAVKENRYRIYQDMYESAAKYLANQNIKGLGICLYAHDEISKKALFEYGFGMRCKDSIMKISEFQFHGVTNCNLKFEELKTTDFPLLHDLRFDLHEHLKESPCFMQADADDYERWITKVDAGDRRTFVAKLANEIVAYIDIAEEGENYITVNPKMRNIQGAYCKPDYRGRKIYDDLLNYVVGVLKCEGYEYLGVDFESYNPTANRFWGKHFKEYTNSVVRRIELWCKEY